MAGSEKPKVIIIITTTGPNCTKVEQETSWDPTLKEELQRLDVDYLRKELWQRIKNKTETKMRLEIKTSLKTGTELLGFFHSAAEWQGCDWQVSYNFLFFCLFV
jgi:hypothetical protein